MPRFFHLVLNNIYIYILFINGFVYGCTFMMQLIQEYFKYYLILKSLNSIGDFFNHEAKK